MMLSKTIKSLFLFVAFFGVLKLEARDFYLQLGKDKVKIIEDRFNLVWLFKDAYVESKKYEHDENEPFVMKLDVHFNVALRKKGITFSDIKQFAKLLDEKLDLKSITRKNFDKLIILADFFCATERKDRKFRPERDILELLIKKRIEYAGVKDYEAFARGEGILFSLNKKDIKVKADWFVKLKHKGSPFYPNPMFLENRMWAESDKSKKGNKIKIGRLILDGENIEVKFETLPFNFSTKKYFSSFSKLSNGEEHEEIASVALLPDGKIAILKNIELKKDRTQLVEVWKPISKKSYVLQWGHRYSGHLLRYLVSLKDGVLALYGFGAEIYSPHNEEYMKVKSILKTSEEYFSRFLSKDGFFIQSNDIWEADHTWKYKKLKTFSSNKVIHAYALPRNHFCTLEIDEKGSVDFNLYRLLGQDVIKKIKKVQKLSGGSRRNLKFDKGYLSDRPNFNTYPFMSYDGIVCKAHFNYHSHVSSLMIPLMSVIPYEVITFEQSMFIQWLWRASLTMEPNRASLTTKPKRSGFVGYFSSLLGGWEKPYKFEGIEASKDSLEERILLDKRLRRIFLSLPIYVVKTIKDMQWLTFKDEDWKKLYDLTTESKKRGAEEKD